MKFKVKGFPTQVSEEVKLPDMAELLMSPNFYDISIDEFYKYASPWQKDLMSMVKLSGTKKYVTVMSQVRVLTPDTRCCTHFNENALYDSFKEWHIDCEEEFDESMKRIYEENDIVHLLSTDCTGMTEFNVNEFEVELDPSNPAGSFYDYIDNNRHLVQGKTIPANRIITFTNHLHRAIKPKRVEFRYMLRVVETDRKRPPSNKFYHPGFKTTVIDANGDYIPNIEQTDEAVKVYVPQYVKERLNYRGGLHSDVESKIVEPDRIIGKRTDCGDIELNIYIKAQDLIPFDNYKWTFDNYIELFDVMYPENFFRLKIDVAEKTDENGELVIKGLLYNDDLVHLNHGRSYGLRQPNSENKHIIATTTDNYFTA